MASLTVFHREVLDTLTAVFDPSLTDPDGAGGSLRAQFGPAHDLPHGPDGRVRQCVVLWPTSGAEATRNAGGVHQRTDTVLVVFVGATVLDCLAAVDRGRAALADARLTASGRGGGRMREGGFTGAQPSPEPGTDPVRVSLTVQFDAISKDPR